MPSQIAVSVNLDTLKFKENVLLALPILSMTSLLIAVFASKDISLLIRKLRESPTASPIPVVHLFLTLAMPTVIRLPSTESPPILPPLLLPATMMLLESTLEDPTLEISSAFLLLTTGDDIRILIKIAYFLYHKTSFFLCDHATSHQLHIFLPFDTFFSLEEKLLLKYS